MEGLTGILNENDLFRYFPRASIIDLIEIVILTFFFYHTAKSLKGTRAWVMLKGIVIILGFYAVSGLLGFNVITALFQNLILFLGIAIIITIQPELRKMIERLGNKNINVSLNNLIFKNTKQRVCRLSDATITELVKSCYNMAKDSTGALIVIECDIPLNEYIESGIKLNADITSQLLINIFEDGTPLHDGAVIIKNDRIAAATCYLPLSDNKSIDKGLGTRHRAGIGVSETTDSLVIIVSEETGAVSIAHGGKLKHGVDREKLTEELKKIQYIREGNTAKKSSKRKQSNYSNHNIGLKLICLAGTCLLWAVMITALNPVTKGSINNLKIQLVNTDIITDTGKTFNTVGSDLVSVKITGRKSLVDKITPNDIVVTADFSKLSLVNAIPIEYSLSSGFEGCDIQLSQSTLQISLEDIVTTELNIDTVLIGKEDDTKYISDIELSSDTLMISGAKSVINRIGRVELDIDRAKLSDSKTELTLSPIIFDKNGDIISKDRLKLNYESIDAIVSVYKAKEVPLNININIKNKMLSSIISNIDYKERTVYITGPDDIIDKYNSIYIDYELDISLGEITKSQFIRVIAIDKLVPAGVIIPSAYSKVDLNIDFVEFYTKNIVFNTSSIRINGIGKDLIATVERKDISIDIVSTDKGIENKSLSDISPYIELSSLSVGEHEVAIKFGDLQDNIFGDLKIKVVINSEG